MASLGYLALACLKIKSKPGIAAFPALGSLRQEDHEFETSLDYIARTWANTVLARIHMVRRWIVDRL